MTGYLLEIAQAILVLFLAPGLVGFVRWLKARLQSRRGAPPWQPYFELTKLFGKEVVMSNNASWLFRFAPYIVFASTLAVVFLVPFLAAPLPFDSLGDLLVVVYLLLLGTFFLALAGLDPGTAFGGMGASRYFCGMKYPMPLIAALTLLSALPAQAIVGGGAPSTDGVARSVVTIVGSRGNFCTGSLIAPKVVLTAAHCVQPGAEYKIVDRSSGRPALQAVRSVAIHPGFRMEAMLAHRATADVALLQLDAPAKGKAPASLATPNVPIAVGGRFTVAGIGVTVRGDGRSGGTVRVAGLVATGKPGTLQIRLVDPVGQGTRDGLGACTGDSGAPVFEDKPSGPAIVGVVSWSTGPNGSAGCGGMTGVTPLTLYRDWVLQTARQWGAAL